MVTQEGIITIKLAKNIEARVGKTIKIGSTTKRLGGLNEEDFEKMRSFGIKMAKEIGVNIDTNTVKEILDDEDFQAELGLESKFCNEYWYIRREYEISKYFSTRQDIKDALIDIMIDELKKGEVKDSYSDKIYKIDVDKNEVNKFIIDFDKEKEMLGL